MDDRTAKSGSEYRLSALRRAYVCRCRQAVFFRNSHCLTCHSELGYDPDLGQVLPLDPVPGADTWQATTTTGTGVYRRCANLNTPAACNWLVAAAATGLAPALCASCRLNRIIPDLTNSQNSLLWGRLEEAKRRVISALIALRLPVSSRISEDPVRGLAFDFLRSPSAGPPILTGHHNGLITINVEEADDVVREQTRHSMREPYRTLVGHFRHEIGHYYWDRLVAGAPWHAGFRILFGDERIDYQQALRRNYQSGPTADWPDRFVSAYASIHPWEDWAETWAHYMHMVDALGTAVSFGLNPDSIAMPFHPFSPEALHESDEDGDRFLTFLNAWVKLTAVMNELCRSMGQPDFYPFALPTPAVAKLHFIHKVVLAFAGVNETSAFPLRP